jgi:hypothetical protein
MTIDLKTIPRGEPGEHWVYSHIGEDGTVLYVGCTSRPRDRTRAHKSAASWWSEVARVKVFGPWAVRADALAEERRRIEESHPPFNITHTPRKLEVAQRGHTTRRLNKVPTNVLEAEQRVLAAETVLRAALGDLVEAKKREWLARMGVPADSLSSEAS